MGRQSKKQQVRIRGIGKCIFCDFYGKLTGEHQYAAWLSEYLPLALSASNHSHFVNVKNLRPDAHPEIPTHSNRKKIAGDPGSRKIIAVCGGCNSGWMSRLQDATKPILAPALTGGWGNFREGLAVIVKWILMTAMVFDQDNAGPKGFTEEERHTLRAYEVERHALKRKETGGDDPLLIKALPQNLFVWVGAMKPESPNRTKAQRCWLNEDGSRCLAFSMHIGDFLVQVAKVHESHMPTMQAYADLVGAHLIWPAPNALVAIDRPQYVKAQMLSEQHVNFVEDMRKYNYERFRVFELVYFQQYPAWRFDPQVR